MTEYRDFSEETKFHRGDPMVTPIGWLYVGPGPLERIGCQTGEGI